MTKVAICRIFSFPWVSYLNHDGFMMVYYFVHFTTTVSSGSIFTTLPLTEPLLFEKNREDLNFPGVWMDTCFRTLSLLITTLSHTSPLRAVFRKISFSNCARRKALFFTCAGNTVSNHAANSAYFSVLRTPSAMGEAAQTTSPLPYLLRRAMGVSLYFPITSAPSATKYPRHRFAGSVNLPILTSKSSAIILNSSG